MIVLSHRFPPPPFWGAFVSLGLGLSRLQKIRDNKCSLTPKGLLVQDPVEFECCWQLRKPGMNGLPLNYCGGYCNGTGPLDVG